MKWLEARCVALVIVALVVSEALSTSLAATARAQEPEPAPYDAEAVEEGEGGGCECEDEDVNDYDEAGVVEVGGSLGFSWTEELFNLDLGPTLGWFILDGLELSLFARLDYENTEQDDGTRSDNWAGSLVLEPSYHVAIHEESVYAFAGLGVGAGYDGSDADFELIPRVGLNIEFGAGGVLTPALRAPIQMGPGKGDGDDFGVRAGVAFEIGVTSTL